MGRCQAGFCSPKVMEILEREIPMSMFDVRKSGEDSKIVVGYNKKI
jgi:glycerol-3-phosphate dehydrogenase